MKLVLYPDERAFAENLRTLRDLCIRRNVKLFLNVIRNGRAESAAAARVISHGFGGEIGFGYTGEFGETRCLLSEISQVNAYFSNK